MTTLLLAAAAALIVTGDAVGRQQFCWNYRSTRLPAAWRPIADLLAERVGEDVDKYTGKQVRLRCLSARDKCAALWTINNDNSTFMLLQGCYSHPKDTCSSTDRCERDSHFDAGGMFKRKGNSTRREHWCCCHDELCNSRDNLAYVEEIEEEMEEDVAWQRDCLLGVALLLSVLLLLACCGRTGIAVARWRRCSKERCSDDLLRHTDVNEEDMSRYQLGELLGKGFFAAVWRGHVPGEPDSQTIAVKVFTAARESYFHTEVAMLQRLSLFSHPHIIRLVQCGKVQMPRGSEWWLGLELCAGESLQDRLKVMTLTWPRLLSTARGVADALTFLHGETTESGVTKGRIAHRDVNSTNILFRGDESTPVLADFGLASEARDLQEARLAELGTLRYMSPELLDGSLDRTQPVLSLIQADIYACALVFWEMMWRCECIWELAGHTGADVPPYALPFHEWTGQPATNEEMQACVVRAGRRPAPPHWAKHTEPFSSLCTLISAMWAKEPNERPSMHSTREQLDGLVRQGEDDKRQKRDRRRSSIFPRSNHNSVSIDDPPTVTAL